MTHDTTVATLDDLLGDIMALRAKVASIEDKEGVWTDGAYEHYRKCRRFLLMAHSELGNIAIPKT